MFGFIGKLFGNEKAVTSAAKGIYNGVDAIVYTEEEKAEMRLKVLSWVNEYMAATTGQNLARRLIAIVITALWAFLMLLGIALELLGLSDQSDYVLQMLVDNVLQPFSIVVGFYFLTHAIKGLNRPK